MKVLISGASGFIGKGLVSFFESSPEYEVFKLVRQRPKQPDQILWDPSAGRVYIFPF